MMYPRGLPGITRREFLKTAAGISVVSLRSRVASAPASSGARPNILYLMTDQHRSDCLGCAGNRVIKTPNLDSLAADGRQKYIYYAYDGREQLFDLDRDSGECHDLAGESSAQDTLQRWRQRMVAHLFERGREFVENGALRLRQERLLYSPNYPGKCT